ncbi:NUDIX domain-containing protein [Paenibacillus sp. TRM 82003]|nr:NUDIX domain-containing protein [Paenibacillus sp. TRM 82003]
MLDIFDEKMNWIGVRTREDVHRKGYWHQTFQCWFFSRADGETYVYFQRRHATKADFPGLLDITAAGHMEAGETREQGFREIEEELGVSLTPDEAHYLGVVPGRYRKEGFVDNEFCHVHAYLSEVPHDAFRFADGEVSALVRAKLDDAVRLVRGEVNEIRGLEFVPGVEEGEMVFRVEHVVPHERSYYETVFGRWQELFS